ncbi:capsid assembly protein [Coralloluteibacterium stylophorae]|uniref:Capsid assembly protein n=1 Tax=Coralloluteibacterium stylophorae TaxID=1776034 RepID=A0A8J7VQZ9_9GAMM|nr:hypothetical protein [Coralloluteibacterium stylophorae]MBS7457690.1 hypothetical protein [Coralloluteibacterium stylophorae]
MNEATSVQLTADDEAQFRADTTRAAEASAKGEQAPPESEKDETEVEGAPEGGEGTEGSEGSEGDLKIDEPAPSDDEARKQVADAGLDWDALNGEYAEKGGLSDDTYAALEAKGIPRKAVDRYIAGTIAENERFLSAVQEPVGGATGYAELVKWGASNLSPAEITAYNKAVESNDTATAKLAVEGLKARMEKAKGKTPGLINGKGGGGGSSVKPFASQFEVTKAMSHPDYRRDPGYRAKVQERLKASQNLF